MNTLNQCDGCCLGLPVRNGIHYFQETGYAHMVCSKELYKRREAMKNSALNPNDVYLIIAHGESDDVDFRLCANERQVRQALIESDDRHDFVGGDVDDLIEAFNDPGRWDFHGRYWSISFDIGAIEAWRMPRAAIANFQAEAMREWSGGGNRE